MELEELYANIIKMAEAASLAPPQPQRPQTKGKIYAALAKAIGMVELAPKDAKHQQGWTYTSDAAVARVAKAALSACELTAPIPIRSEPMESYGFGRNKVEVMQRLYFWEIGHSSDEFIHFETIGTSQVTDKSPYAMLTGARKNALTTILCIERQDEPEEQGDQSDPQHQQQDEPAPQPGLSLGDLVALINARQLDPAMVEAFMVSKGRPSFADMAPDVRYRLVGWLDTAAGRKAAQNAASTPKPAVSEVPNEAEPDAPRVMSDAVAITHMLNRMKLSIPMVNRWLESVNREPMSERDPVDVLAMLEKIENGLVPRVTGLRQNWEEALAQYGIDPQDAMDMASEKEEAPETPEAFNEYLQFLLTPTGKAALAAHSQVIPSE